MQFTFRCKCGVLVITTDGNRFKCRSCEPREASPQEVYRQTRMLKPPRRVTKEKDDDDAKT